MQSCNAFFGYFRTETNIFPKELDLTPLVQAQTNDQRWGGKNNLQPIQNVPYTLLIVNNNNKTLFKL